MIQRKQTLFLIAAFVLLVISAFEISVSFKTDENLVLATLSNFSLSDGKSSNLLYSVMGVMILGAAVLNVITILGFHNRKRQMKMCWWTIFILLSYYITRMSCVIGIAKSLKLTPQFDFYEAFPLMAIVFVVLAYKGVRHDEKLVRDSYRIR